MLSSPSSLLSIDRESFCWRVKTLHCRHISSCAVLCCSRVLYLAMSPDGQSIVTGAGDETLRFWNVFPGPKLSFGSALGTTVLFPSGGDIR